MMRRILQAVVVAAALTASAVRAEDAAETSIIGPWVGTYTCGQGLTGISLTITEAHEGRAEALFHFYAVPENPGVPTGCFLQSGTYNAETRRVTLRGGRWLLQPPDYVTVGFSGQLDRAGRRLTGKVIGPRGCTTFRMERRAESASVPAACRPQVAAR
jgi:hypothetical protein